jgi:outer membrane lipoprotein carrier protein
MTTKYAATGQTQEVTGTVAIRKPDKFRVNYEKPQVQTFVSNGKSLWVYTPSLNQVIKQDIKKANLDTHFYIEFETSIDYYARRSKNTLTENESDYIIKMKPKSEETGYEEIVAKIDKKTLALISMTMKYEGIEVEVKFTDIKGYNSDDVGKQTELKLSSFEFKVPEGAEEIEASNMIEGMGQ